MRGRKSKAPPELRAPSTRPRPSERKTARPGKGPRLDTPDVLDPPSPRKRTLRKA